MSKENEMHNNEMKHMVEAVVYDPWYCVTVSFNGDQALQMRSAKPDLSEWIRWSEPDIDWYRDVWHGGDGPTFRFPLTCDGSEADCASRAATHATKMLGDIVEMFMYRNKG